MSKEFQASETLLKEFKGDTYLHGIDILSGVGGMTVNLGESAVLITDRFPGCEIFIGEIKDSLMRSGVNIVKEIAGAAPNAPREDLLRITEEFRVCSPDVILSFGGGSTIDATKAASVLHLLGCQIDDYFGTGLVSRKIEISNQKLLPHIAIQTASSSAAHLTKYSNITDIKTGQKKLIVDNAIVPIRSVFDYRVTNSAPRGLTADGSLDGISHALEVLYSAVGKPGYQHLRAIASEVIRLVVTYLPRVLADLNNAEGRYALGLATDLGGYSIMLGGTNGAHLTSFSLVDILSHGRACGLMNTYYTVFFAPAIEDPLRVVGKIYRDAGYTQASIDQLTGRKLGVAVAEAMIAFENAVGFPSRLVDVPGFTDAHIERALTAAKNLQLKMKLENMPVPMNAEMVDDYMGPILQAAKYGDLDLIRNVP